MIDATGVTVFGEDEGLYPERQATVTVNNLDFYRRLALGGGLGAAESYMDGEWVCDDLTALIRALAANSETLTRVDGRWARFTNSLGMLAHRLLARNTRSGSKRNIEAHYDLGNGFFELFLDSTMMYSSAVFEHADMTLQQASENKLNHICRRLDLQAQDHVIEIGTGWGGFAVHAAQNFGCEITSTTISPSQFQFAGRRVADTDFADRIHLLQSDYRDLSGQYDKLVSIEMIEAVGHEFLDEYFRKCNSLLKSGGRMVIQAIVIPEQRHASYIRSVDFIQKYIFPGGCLPSVASMQDSVGRVTDLRLIGVTDFSESYAATLREWRKRFFARIDEVRSQGFDDRFVQMWDYYFSYCEAAFLERAVGVAQLEWVKA